MQDTLLKITEHLNSHNITWAVGGSLMLSIRGLETTPNDIDLLVTESDAPKLIQVLETIGPKQQPKSSHPHLFSSYFSQFHIDEIGIDVMANFGVKHEKGMYVSPLHVEALEQSPFPLSSLEDWYVLYLLMPNRESKVTLIEDYFQKHGVSKSYLLKQALTQSLPSSVINRIERVLTHSQMDLNARE
ncbi:nucleotidyltransferase domain-containing protein [Alkalihalobacillus sp. NPDC078783]